MMTKTIKKRFILPALALKLIFSLGMLCSCGSSSADDEATEATTEKATVTAGEAAAQADEKAKEATKKTGTEDPAIEAAKAKATKDIKGFDGNWENLSVDVDDPITVIDFDWKGTHYQYTFDQTSGKIIK